MRAILIVVPLVAFLLAACGTTERTTVVNAPPGSTVVVPANGDAHVVN
jgi:hypothetical protein